MKRRMVNIGLVFILVLLLVQTAESQQKSLDWDNPIKVGYINPFTGPASLVTSRDVVGLQLAVEEINNAGGVLGRPFKLITRDSKMNPEVGLREAKDLLTNENVFWIQGTTSSAVARVVSNYMKDQKRLFVIVAAKSEKFYGEWWHRYLFRACDNMYAEARGMAMACRQTFGPLKKIYNFNPDFEGGHAMWRNFFAGYKKLVPDVKVVGEIWTKLGSQDYTSNITAIMNSDAELLFTGIFQTDAITFLKQSDALGLNGKIPVAAVNFGEPGTVEHWNAKLYPKKTLAGVSSMPFWAMDTPEGKSFVQKIKSKYGVYPGYAASSYSFFKAVAKAIEKARALDTEKVIDNLEGYVMQAPTGTHEIRACDHQAIIPISMGRIEEIPGWDFYGPKKIVKIGQEAYQTCEEIAKIRGK